MSDTGTHKLLKAYNQNAEPTAFMASQFKSPPENFHTSLDVEIDIERGEEDVAIVISDISVGANQNSADLYTNKRFTPPIFKEEGGLNVYDLLKRSVGNNPFADIKFQAEAIIRSFKMIKKTDSKIRRSIELQASQVLQTGIVTLIDSTGATKYTIDYKPKATHFPTAGTTWDQASDDKIGDLISLSNVLRTNGLHDPDMLIFGQTAFNSFLNDTTVQARLDNRRLNVGMVAPVNRGAGATFQGWVQLDHYRFEMWTYSGRFKHPQTGVSTEFMDDGKVSMRASSGRLDLSFGAVPRIIPVKAEVMPFLPSRISNSDGRMDIFPNAYITPDGGQLFVGSSARPLAIPTAIDTIGCLDTGL